MIHALRSLWFSLRPPAACGNCRYWAEGVGDGANDWAQGSCRLEGPRVVTYSAPAPVVSIHGKPVPAQLNVQSYWPPVTPAEWCGRHRRRLL